MADAFFLFCEEKTTSLSCAQYHINVLPIVEVANVYHTSRKPFIFWSIYIDFVKV